MLHSLRPYSRNNFGRKKRYGERVTLGRGLVNQLVAPLVEVSGPFFFRCLGYTFGIPQKVIYLYFPQSSLYATPTLLSS